VAALDTPGSKSTLSLWFIEKFKLEKNLIAPICLYNKGNTLETEQNFIVFRNKVKF
jgi:hypothetical protein